MATTQDSCLEEPIVKEIAKKLGKSPAQVVLRWAVQRGTAVIPKTTDPARLAENLNVFDFNISDEDMKAISSLNKDRRFNDPGFFCEEAFNTFYPIYD